MKKRNDGGRKKEFSPSKVKTGVSVAALIAAVATFVIMLQIEKSVLAQYEKQSVYVAETLIPRGQMITETNFMQYFSLQEMDIRHIPETALKGPEQAYGLVARFDVERGLVLTEGMFEEMESILEGMEEPVIAGFRAEDMYQVAGGTLRTGDWIHIYSIMEDGTVSAWEEVYVQQVFDASGSSIPNGDGHTAAQRVNIYLDKKDVEAFYKGLAEGGLRVVKVCDSF